MGQRRERKDSLKTLFARNINEKELNRNRYLITEEEERELEDLDELDDFLDSGIYSASRELAMLANLIHRGATNKPRPEQPKGRAVFEAKDLKTTIPPVNKVKPTPEPEPEPEPAPKQPEKNIEQQIKEDIARTPEEIRRKLEQRKYQSSGRASFGTEDTEPEPEQPWEFHSQKPADSEKNKKADEQGDEKQDKEDEKPASKKAVFESRDVSQPPWNKH